MKIEISIGIVFAFLLSSSIVFSQATLRPNEIKKFDLSPAETKVFNLNLKKDDYAEINLTAPDDADFAYKIFAPSGKNVLDYAVVLDNSFPFVALENGIYKIEIKRDKSETATSAREFSAEYKNKFVFPKSAVLKSSRKINGYDAKIYELKEEFGDAYLLIERAGRLKFISKGSKFAIGLYFPDAAAKDDSAEMKRSAALFRRTADKTGDGTPDLAVGYYSGGAHCCFSMYFYELGDEITPVKSLDTGDADIAAVGTSPNGGLQLSSGDNTFAYWNTSFAGSPIPNIILTFRDGEFRADAKLMRKPAAPLAELKREAATIRAKMPLDAYVGDEAGGTFIESFWGRMLELIYAGHEDLAWQYFDWAWNPKKKGKEIFRKDFEKRLAKSEFYRMFTAGK